MRAAALAVAAAVLAVACGGGDDGGQPSVDDDTGLTAALSTIDAAVEARLGGAADFSAAPATAAMALGDQARTDVTGFAEVAYPDGSLTRLDGNSTFTLVELSMVEESQAARASLDVGRAWNRVESVTASEGRFEVDTSVATAAVRGTAFDVDCRAACLFSVLDGIVAVTTSSGDTVEVTAGTAVEVAQDGTAGPLLALAYPLDPWFLDNAERDVAAGFDPVAEQPDQPDQAAQSPGIGGTWEVTFTVEESNDPQSPPGAQNSVTWQITMSCPSGPCDGAISTEDVPVANFTFTDAVYRIDETGEQTTVACRDAGVVAFDRRSTGTLQATHADPADLASGVRFVGTLTEVLTPRADAVATGCVEDVTINRVTALRGVLA